MLSRHMTSSCPVPCWSAAALALSSTISPFNGKTRDSYGRWTYKYEIGAAKGARGVILVHTNEAAGYPWEVVRNSWGAETSYVHLKPGEPALHFASWMTSRTAAELFKNAGLDLEPMTNP